MDNYCDAIKTILKARDDPAQLEDYFYLMLEDEYGYETTRAKIEDYFENHSLFCFKVDGRDFRKENLSKDREWPMLVDELWDDIRHEPSEYRDSIRNILEILSREANIRIEETDKEEYDKEEYDKRGNYIRDYEDMEVPFEELALPRDDYELKRYQDRLTKEIAPAIRIIAGSESPIMEEAILEDLNDPNDYYNSKEYQQMAKKELLENEIQGRRFQIQ